MINVMKTALKLDTQMIIKLKDEKESSKILFMNQIKICHKLKVIPPKHTSRYLPLNA